MWGSVILNIIISLSKEICKYVHWKNSNFGVYFQYSLAPLVSLKIFPNGIIRSYVAHEKKVTDTKFLELEIFSHKLYDESNKNKIWWVISKLFHPKWWLVHVLVIKHNVFPKSLPGVHSISLKFHQENIIDQRCLIKVFSMMGVHCNLCCPIW